MILFSIAVEPLLRILEKMLCDPHDALGAYADDIGLVLCNVFQQIPFLAQLFQLFDRASNLELNLSKTVFIPLWAHCDLPLFA